MFIRIKRQLDQDEPASFVNISDTISSNLNSPSVGLKRFKLYRPAQPDPKGIYDIYIKTEPMITDPPDQNIPLVQSENYEYLHDLYVDEFVESGQEESDNDSNDENYYANDYPDEDGDYSFNRNVGNGNFYSRYSYEAYDDNDDEQSE